MSVAACWLTAPVRIRSRWESRKARKIVRSRDISYAFTNVMSQNWYGLRSYDHFCFFCQIDNSKKKKDEFAFFIFFTFKGWKRLLLADAPRQVINGISLYSFAASENFTTDISTYFSGSLVKSITIVTMCFSVVVWAGSFFLLVVAAALYVPLLCYIQVSFGASGFLVAWPAWRDWC